MRRFNINEGIWFAILMGFTYYLYHLISTDKILIFIHPKMLKYIYFSFVVFIVLSLIQFKRVFRGSSRESIKIGFILFLVPLILGFAVDPTELNTSVAAKKGVTITGNNKGSITIEATEQEDISRDGVITFSDENFSYFLESIYKDMEKYNGNKVIITGFVFREPDFKEDEFVIARLLMNCCAADSQIVGVLSRGEAGKNMDQNQWVRVTGTLGITVYHDPVSGTDDKMPMIHVEEVEQIEKPVNQYVYP